MLAAVRPGTPIDSFGPARFTTTRWSIVSSCSDSANDEEKAQALLKAAKPLLPVNKAAAQKRLKEIVEAYPDTDAAGEARKLLGK